MRILLEIAYRGPDFKGWQSQAHGGGVQDVIERALAALTAQPVRIHGAGRTDAGVHALGQMAHFDAPQPLRFPANAWAVPLNSQLPPSVRILASHEVSPEFHARFDATGKEYHYLLQTGPVFHPLLQGRAWHYPSTLDVDLLHAAWDLFLGKHDFRYLSVGRNPPPTSTIRTLHHVEVQSSGSLHRFIVRGDGFLYRMVRCLVGAAVRVARGKDSMEQLRRALQGEEYPRRAAAAEGLYLVRVFYQKEYRIGDGENIPVIWGM